MIPLKFSTIIRGVARDFEGAIMSEKALHGISRAGIIFRRLNAWDVLHFLGRLKSRSPLFI
jgi:hypothetical protein